MYLTVIDLWEKNRIDYKYDKQRKHIIYEQNKYHFNRHYKPELQNS